jgi:hypothetical protein
MAALSISGLQTKLSTRLNDSSDRTFSSSEKTEMLTSAIQNEHVYDIIRDDSNTTTANTASYDISGTGITDLTDVQVDVLGDGFGHPIDRDGYEVMGDTLYFDPAKKGIPADKTLILIGKQKLTESDQIPEFLQEYVLTLATVEAYRLLAATYTTRFLKNDVTLAEILRNIQDLENKAAQLRTNLRNRRSVRS